MIELDDTINVEPQLDHIKQLDTNDFNDSIEAGCSHSAMVGEIHLMIDVRHEDS
jgi:hypothetical protein